MSTAMDNIAGKGRNLSTNFWLGLLVASLVVFGANTGYSIYKASRLSGASGAASDLQVNSQRLANQGREAVGGNADSFAAFKATKDQIDSDIKLLNDRYGDAAGVSGPIKTVTATWAPLAKSAEQVTASQQAVLGLAGNADRFTQQVPQLQAQMDEVVRAMSASAVPTWRHSSIKAASFGSLTSCDVDASEPGKPAGCDGCAKTRPVSSSSKPIHQSATDARIPSPFCKNPRTRG